MVKDKAGKPHPNAQMAMASDKRMGGIKPPPMGGMKPPMAAKPPLSGPPEMGGGEHMQVHDHGDGSFHTVSKEGEQTEHPTVGHMLMHVAHSSAPEHGHTHVMHNAEGGHTSHHVMQDGEIQGPHEHPDMESLAEHMRGMTGEGGGGNNPQEDAMGGGY